MLDDENLTSTNLGNDHEFIIKEYSLHEIFWRSFGEAESKAKKAYGQSEQYHTIVENSVHLTSISCFLPYHYLTNLCFEFVIARSELVH